MLYPIAHIFLSDADFRRRAEKFTWQTLLANALAIEAQNGKLRSNTGGTRLGDTLHLPPPQAETIRTIRVFKDLALVNSKAEYLYCPLHLLTHLMELW